MRIALNFLSFLLFTVSVAAGGSVSCTGWGTGAPVELVTPSELDFGQVDVGMSTDRSFWVKNDAPVGHRDLIGTVWLGEACNADYSILGFPIEYSIAPGESLEVIVRLSPTSLGEKICDVQTGDWTP